MRDLVKELEPIEEVIKQSRLPLTEHIVELATQINDGQMDYIEQLTKILVYPANRRIDDMIPDVYFSTQKGEYLFMNGQAVPEHGKAKAKTDNSINNGSAFCVHHRSKQEKYLRSTILPAIAYIILERLEQNGKELVANASPKVAEELYLLGLRATNLVPSLYAKHKEATLYCVWYLGDGTKYACDRKSG